MENLRIWDVRVHKADSAFLLDDGQTAILYDSGFGFTGDRVAEKIRKHLGERKLDYIFLTHSHYDHALGAAYVLRHWPAAKVVAGEYATRIFAKPTAKALMRKLDRAFADTCGEGAYEDRADDLRVDIPVKDGDVIRAGNLEFVAVELPGHTKCSVGYFCREKNLLLACETLGVYDGAGDVVPSYLVGCQMTIDSIDKALALKPQNILTPHFGLLTGEAAQSYLQRGRARALQTAEETVAALRAGQTKQQIAEAIEKRIWHGYMKEIYPLDAMRLNTGIMIDMLQRELMEERQ